MIASRSAGARDSLRVRIDDDERLEALHSYKIMDTPPEPSYEKLIDLVHAVCQGAWSAVTFVARERQWFKAIRGTTIRETDRAMSFCSVGMQQLAPLVIENALLDPRFKDNPLVLEQGIRFFAGYPLFSSEGYGLGSVCVLSMHPRTLLVNQMGVLEKARNWIHADLERRRAALMWNGGAGCPSGEERLAGDQRQALKRIVAEKAWEILMASAPPPGPVAR